MYIWNYCMHEYTFATLDSDIETLNLRLLSDSSSSDICVCVPVQPVDPFLTKYPS